MLPLFLTLITISVISAQLVPEGSVIGIVTLPSDIAGFSPDQWSYFPSSYVKFVESGGAQVIPIPFDLPQKNISYLLDGLNGVLFTGGDAAYLTQSGNLTHMAQTLQYIVNYVVKKNNNGVYYPLWGTCEGYEAIGMILANNFSVRTQCVGCEAISKNNFVNDAYQSRLMANMDSDLVEKITYEKLSYFAQSYKFQEDLFDEGGQLYNILMPVTFAYDVENAKYASSFESPNMPIYGIQFHQEKSTFEWNSGNPYNHALDAVRLQQYYSLFFVNETTGNQNKLTNYTDFLIDNYQAVVVNNSGYTSVYVFPTGTELPYIPPHKKYASLLSVTGIFVLASMLFI